MNKRQNERHIVEFPVRFAGNCKALEIVYNLCKGGCKIVTDQPLTIGGMVALTLNVPKQALSITICMATLRWMLKNEFGVEFLGMEELRRERLAQYLRGLAAAAA
jgi:hypothetical protein